MNFHTADLSDITPSPWYRIGWRGDLVSIEDCDASDCKEDDVAEVIAWNTSGDRWDGDTAGIVKLKDGRFMFWEAIYGPTGVGFVCDAYGGDADLCFASNLETVMRYLSDTAKSLLLKPQ